MILDISKYQLNFVSLFYCILYIITSFLDTLKFASQISSHEASLSLRPWYALLLWCPHAFCTKLSVRREQMHCCSIYVDTFQALKPSTHTHTHTHNVGKRWYKETIWTSSTSISLSFE